MEKNKTPLKQLLKWINYKYPETVITANEIRHKIEELLPEERKMVEDAWQDGFMEYHKIVKAMTDDAPRLTKDFKKLTFDYKHEQ